MSNKAMMAVVHGRILIRSFARTSALRLGWGTRLRRFTREFKLEAVRMVAGGRHSLAQVVRELDPRGMVLRPVPASIESIVEGAN